jgi:hypothetical protein
MLSVLLARAGVDVLVLEKHVETSAATIRVHGLVILGEPYCVSVIKIHQRALSRSVTSVRPPSH